MADNYVEVNQGTNTTRKKIAVDEYATVQYPLYKQAFSENGDEPVHVSAEDPLPVTAVLEF